MNEIKCKARNGRKILLTNCVPNPAHADCKTCNSPNKRYWYYVKQPKRKITIDKKHIPLLKSIQKYINEKPISPLNELYKLIYEIGQKGANLDIILNNIDFLSLFDSVYEGMRKMSNNISGIDKLSIYKVLNWIDVNNIKPESKIFSDSYSIKKDYFKKFNNSKKSISARFYQTIRIKPIEQPRKDSPELSNIIVTFNKLLKKEQKKT